MVRHEISIGTASTQIHCCELCQSLLSAKHEADHSHDYKSTFDGTTVLIKLTVH